MQPTGKGFPGVSRGLFAWLESAQHFVDAVERECSGVVMSRFDAGNFRSAEARMVGEVFLAHAEGEPLRAHAQAQVFVFGLEWGAALLQECEIAVGVAHVSVW